jgi:hypothetical protein
MVIVGVLWIRGVGVHRPNESAPAAPVVVGTAAAERPERMTLGRLSALERRSPEQLDTIFMRSAAHSLPNVGSGGGVLQSLTGD